MKRLLHLAAYHPEEIERVLDPKRSFVKFDPDLGYVLLEYKFKDGMEGTRTSYTFEEHGGHRKMINYTDQPCRINTYGNSYTQCAQVSDGETWQEILAAHFREPMRNFGVGGYGVYQAYLTAMRMEVTDLASEYIILNIWDDDHMRNIDAARWIRVAWMCRDLPRAGEGVSVGTGGDVYPVHGFPWGHVRYDLKKNGFVELPGLCRNEDDLRKLADKNVYYETFKDDQVAQLYCLREGGEAPVEPSEKIAEALGVKVNLRDKTVRAGEARKLHLAYGMRSTMFIVDKFARWAADNKRKLLLLLSYDVPQVKTYLEKKERFDDEFLAYVKDRKYLCVDCLAKAGEEYKDYNLPIDDFLLKFYIGRAGAQVFGHYNPHGNFWFAYAIRQALVDWLNPKPPSYR